MIKGEVPADDYVLPIGKADVKRDGEDITVITYGLCVHFALQAAEKLASDGISVHILDLRTVYPLDQEVLLRQQRKRERYYSLLKTIKKEVYWVRWLRLLLSIAYLIWMHPL